jgi:hypothetical protein
MRRLSSGNIPHFEWHIESQRECCGISFDIWPAVSWKKLIHSHLPIFYNRPTSYRLKIEPGTTELKMFSRIPSITFPQKQQCLLLTNWSTIKKS